MRKSLIWIGTVIGTAAVLSLIFGALERKSEPRTIATSGECLATAPRDKTAITLRITTLDKSAATSMKMATAKVAEITEFLKTQDVQMQTTQFNSYEKTEWNRDEQKSVVLGIETTISVEVSANNIETIEKILTQFAGQTNVYSENLRMYTSPETLKPVIEDCMARAVENARMRADALAMGDGKRAGKMLAVSYGAQNGNVAYPTSNLMRSAKLEVAAAMDATGTIVSRDTDVSVTVSAVFEIR
ncbi:MAG: SIMPL domain-containing protein [Alphaproteobacteria bacterium]|nr:SIMPL domain-containing protein [Alphaproteobacteria bacterium]